MNCFAFPNPFAVPPTPEVRLLSMKGTSEKSAATNAAANVRNLERLRVPLSVHKG